MSQDHRIAIVIAVASSLTFGAPDLVWADKTDDFRTAAETSGRGGCNTIPYSSEKDDCRKAEQKEDDECKDYTCDLQTMTDAIEKLKKKRSSLSDALSYNNQPAVPNLENAIRTIEQDLKARQGIAEQNRQQGQRCHDQRVKIKELYEKVKGMVENERDPAVLPFVPKLLGKYKDGVTGHDTEIDQTKKAIENCVKVKSLSW